MSPERKPLEYVPESFWEERYSRIDLSRSGHRDLPETYNRWLYRRKQAVLRRGLARIGFAPRGKRVLEIGAGTGAYVDFWKGLGVEHLTGLDISQAAVGHVRERHPEFSFLHRDITRPALRSDCGGDFDLATALDVLYHVVDDARLQAALANVADVLRPGGVLAIHDQFLHRPSEDHGYIRWRSLSDWHRLLLSAGFEVVSRAPIFYGMVQPNDCASTRAAERMAGLWSRLSPWIQRAPGLLGVTLYALDSVLGTFVREGPSMELLLARRRA
jgi:SAM-dependent methyltransferase